MEYQEAESEWMEPPTSAKSGFPVELDEYIKNVRANCLLDLPNLKMQKEHDKIMVMVCGGPTAAANLEEIRAKRADDRYRIFTSNKTHDWLISEGIVPHYQFIIDPKANKVKDVQHPHKDVKYLIGISCAPGVFKALEGYDVTRVFSVSGLGHPKDTDIIRVLFPGEAISWLFGGTMAGLRAMSIADVMGFLTVEYYGFDSCYFERDENGDPIYYSYDKMRKENIMEAQTDDGRIFLTSPVFASQAQQYIKWKHRYEWIKFIINGNSLTKAIDEIDEEKLRPKHDLLITDYHRQRNAALLESADTMAKNDNIEFRYGLFGQTGYTYAGPVSVLAGLLIHKYGPITLLDYGCGSQSLAKMLPPITGLTVNHYDPCVPEFDHKPEPADIVVCTDVLEHIEPECLENVLDDLKKLTKKAAYVVIATKAAEKTYSDGQNCHLIVEDIDWWLPKLKKRFFIAEKSTSDCRFTCIMQAKEVL